MAKRRNLRNEWLSDARAHLVHAEEAYDFWALLQVSGYGNLHVREAACIRSTKHGRLAGTVPGLAGSLTNKAVLVSALAFDAVR